MSKINSNIILFSGIAVILSCGLTVLTGIACRDLRPVISRHPAPAGQGPNRPEPRNCQQPQVASQPFTIAVDKTRTFRERVAAISRLGRELTQKQEERIRRIVLDRAEHPTLRNDALVLLSRQRLRLRDLGRGLLCMQKDPRESALWREYCVQHFATVFATDRSRRDLEKRLFDLVDSNDSAAATALISLDRISDSFPHIARMTAARVQRILQPGDSMPALTGPAAELAIAAMQVAVERNLRHCLAYARLILTHKTADVRLRMVATAALARFGSSADLLLLEPLVHDRDRRIRRAALINLRRLRDRHNNGSQG